MKAKLDSQQAFNDFFTEVYGARWPSLLRALREEAERVTLQNPFGEAYQDYLLDAASLLPVKHLAIEQGQRIADFCSSPGGKSLASIFHLKGHANWFCSDLSPARVTRLKSVFYDCLPPSILKQIEVRRGDASRWGLMFRDQFDRVLVDAPCSGERHLLESAKEFARWSLKGAKRLVVRQHALLCSGFDSLKPGGRMVYSTCSISPLENDGVIEKLYKSRAGLFQVIPVHDECGEPTEHGWQVLPDRFKCGPIYFAVISKIP